MTDHADSSLARDIIFNQQQEERKPWKVCGFQWSRTAVLFIVQCTLIFMLASCALWGIIISKSCEETTVWVAVLSSTIGYILPAPSIK